MKERRKCKFETWRDQIKKDLDVRMVSPKDYTKQGILNWICIQEDDRDIGEIIQMCYKKIEAMNELRKRGILPKSTKKPITEDDE